MIPLLAFLYSYALALLAQIPPLDIPDGTTLIQVGVIIGFLMPPAIDLINRSYWSGPAKAASAFVCCLVAAVAVLFAAGQFDSVDFTAQGLFAVFCIIFVTAIGFHHFYWKPSGVSDKLARI